MHEKTKNEQPEQEPQAPKHDARKFMIAIQRTPDFLANMPSTSYRDMQPEEKMRSFREAIGTTALSLADRIKEKPGGEHNLNANLLTLIGTLNDYDANIKIVNEIKRRNQDIKRISPEDRASMKEAKRPLIRFNHALREVINSGASQFSFDELLHFITDAHEIGGENGSRKGKEAFSTELRTKIVGMRNEIAFEQLLIHGGIPYELGSEEDDAAGKDFRVRDIGIDTKASESTTRAAKKQALRRGKNPDHIIWSHINEEDFEGGLALPNHKIAAIWEKLKPDIIQALFPNRKAAQTA